MHTTGPADMALSEDVMHDNLLRVQERDHGDPSDCVRRSNSREGRIKKGVRQ